MIPEFLQSAFHCMDCGAKRSRLIHDKETNRVICEDREICEHMQAWGDSNA